MSTSVVGRSRGACGAVLAPAAVIALGALAGAWPLACASSGGGDGGSAAGASGGSGGSGATAGGAGGAGAHAGGTG
ncbi:MAG: hypothetical protein HY908_12865, partial [Myxococcales bacterium]|nr:hypothetical protein [Myxococcales bacterium]